ncbi:hypothetical protein [Coleofasciculus sp. LEGE 07092]|uniref:hypothetical protein n=1 Tax=Coleofasciculus sp. LEGE 07092 TaxID=2777969 RepID=UPI00187EC4AE|nr:hypothetical protein [Coleofasciculus sp. LEGE 07092]
MDTEIMARAEFHFLAELNYFLPPNKRHVSFTHVFHVFKARTSIKGTTTQPPQ